MALFVLVPGAGGMAWYWTPWCPSLARGTKPSRSICLATTGTLVAAGVCRHRHPRDRGTKRCYPSRTVAGWLHGAACSRAHPRADARIRECDDPQARRDGW